MDQGMTWDAVIKLMKGCGLTSVFRKENFQTFPFLIDDREDWVKLL